MEKLPESSRSRGFTAILTVSEKTMRFFHPIVENTREKPSKLRGSSSGVVFEVIWGVSLCSVVLCNEFFFFFWKFYVIFFADGGVCGWFD